MPRVAPRTTVKQSINRQDFKLKIPQKNKVMMTIKNTPRYISANWMNYGFFF
ncbi:Hypothetical protein ETEE_0392 [Edwardsiella anguillarum ET080813]|uniref:Uncharacterized protein n=1 Tax=Edwardsiella anguillarum ET080813 TaxID=667120 RepID=A0A076LEA6_9GAMM|nr:Hypothetical protein ETEE_0392 [Edwardsiella anguillarum ET080813]